MELGSHAYFQSAQKPRKGNFLSSGLDNGPHDVGGYGTLDIQTAMSGIDNKVRVALCIQAPVFHFLSGDLPAEACAPCFFLVYHSVNV